MRASLAAVALPQDPGEPPIHRNNLPNREEFHVNFMQDKIKLLLQYFLFSESSRKHFKTRKRSSLKRSVRRSKKNNKRSKKNNRCLHSLI